MASIFEDQRDIAALVFPRTGRVAPAQSVVPRSICRRSAQFAFLARESYALSTRR